MWNNIVSILRESRQKNGSNTSSSSSPTMIHRKRSLSPPSPVHRKINHRIFEAQNTNNPYSTNSSTTTTNKNWVGILLAVLCFGGSLSFFFFSVHSNGGSSRSSSWLEEYQMKQKEQKILVTAVPQDYDEDRVHVWTELVENWEWRYFPPSKQLSFLQNFGTSCYSSSDLLLKRYEELPFDFLKVELWKHCLLATGLAQGYIDLYEQVRLLDVNFLQSPTSTIVIQSSTPQNINPALIIYPTESLASKSMVQLLVDSPLSTWQNEKKATLLLSDSFYKKLQEEQSSSITYLQASCLPLAETTTYQKTSMDRILLTTNNKYNKNKLHGQIDSSYSLVSDSATPSDHHPTTYCPKEPSFPCCQVTDHNNNILFLLRHPLMSPSTTTNTPLPVEAEEEKEEEEDEHNDLSLDKKFISAVKPLEVDIPVHENEALQSQTPNFFQILLENDCLPTQKDCHRCLKRTFEDVSATCQNCAKECGCYCRTLCKIRPPPKRVAHKVLVEPPVYRKDPTRLIPKLVHQTWFEKVTPTGYPNMSRLMESWKTSGWEYNFYDDDTIAKFLIKHFPPQVKEAYDAIIPGAFKADLFRYCLLLIRGGVYADMDVLLESNLDEFVTNDVGFMTPIDEPGTLVNRRSCLWNGLIATAPGHPFIAKTIENVVNNIRNRFTSVDYDDMLCPNPVMHVSHSVDMLFTCGPCIFGASVNKILGRHLQTPFNVGEIDIWEVEREASDDKNNIVVQTDDPRLSIYGKSIILKQNKNDMGAHRFTWEEKNLLVAVTDMPDYDDRPPTKEHYSKAHKKSGVYGVNSLYTDNVIADELIEFVIENHVQ